MVSQSFYGYLIKWFPKWFPIIWFLNHLVVYNKMVSQSKNGFPKDGFSIKKWFPKIWFLNQNLVNYMFPNQTSAFSRYSATDSSKCASTTDSSKCASTTDSSKCASTADSSCFRTIIKCITSYDSSVWFKLIVYKVKYSICCFKTLRYLLLTIFDCLSIYLFFYLFLSLFFQIDYCSKSCIYDCC